MEVAAAVPRGLEAVGAVAMAVPQISFAICYLLRTLVRTYAHHCCTVDVKCVDQSVERGAHVYTHNVVGTHSVETHSAGKHPLGIYSAIDASALLVCALQHLGERSAVA